MKAVVGKSERATVIRDHAIALVKSRGRFEPLIEGLNILVGTIDGFTIAYRTPFQQRHLISDGEKYQRAQSGTLVEADFALDIHHAGKVLNIEWNEAGEIDIRSFKRGEWEGRLLSISA